VEQEIDIDIELLLVEALPVRRAHSRIFDLVTRTLDFFASQAKTSAIDLTIDKASNVPAAFLLDGEKIGWALATLVANALRYARAHVAVHVRYAEEEGALVFDVTDDGPGMSAQQTRWLFEANPATGQSAGLALLMVRDVLSAHRGSVSVVSHPGEGTTFTMRIPRPASS
jgi:signal transduction histidine kinase